MLLEFRIVEGISVLKETCADTSASERCRKIRTILDSVPGNSAWASLFLRDTVSGRT